MSGFSRKRTPLFSRWYVRISLKWLVFSLVTLLTLFPSPGQLKRHLTHISNLEAMVTPDAPELATYESELRERLARQFGPATISTARPSQGEALTQPPPSPRDVQRETEKFVLEKIAYDWDWNVWGSADYMPTVAEMFRLAETRPDHRIFEDCDGRAVMAASLMRRLGYDSHIVTDLRHVWVTTREGEWMGPGRVKTVRSTARGNITNFWATISNIPVSLSYGIAVFPFWREAIIAATAFLLMLSRRTGRRAASFAALLLLQGLLFMRLGYMAPQSVSRNVSDWPAWLGLLHMSVAIAILLLASRIGRAARR